MNKSKQKTPASSPSTKSLQICYHEATSSDFEHRQFERHYYCDKVLKKLSSFNQFHKFFLLIFIFGLSKLVIPGDSIN